MRALLDTCVISELQKPSASQTVREAVQALTPEDTYLSVITIGEIAKGIALLDDGARKRGLTTWLAGIEGQFGDQVLSIDTETARVWGEITARARQQGFTVAAADGLIAATALRHGLTLLTRNVADFQPIGVVLRDPW